MSPPHVPACRETLENISAYLDGELDATACDAIERHSLSCPACATLVEDLRRTVGLCRHAAGAGLPEPVRERARVAVQRLLHDAPRP